MGTTQTADWEDLERWSPALFLISGVMLIVYATAQGLWAFTDLMPQKHGLEIAYTLGFLGLLGLYPRVSRRSPTLARVGAIAAASGVIAIIYVSMNDYVQITGLVDGNLPGWELLRATPLIGFILGYLAFGLASLRSSVYSRTVGLLLLLPGVITILMLASIITGHPLLSQFQTVFVVSAGEAMAHLAIGTTLRSEAAATDEPEGDTDTEQEVVASE